MENWYVYYPATGAPALPLLREMQRQLAQHAEVQARLEERVGSAASATWMEVYEGVNHPEEFAKLLDAAVGQVGVTETQRAARRLERFRRL